LEEQGEGAMKSIPENVLKDIIKAFFKTKDEHIDWQAFFRNRGYYISRTSSDLEEWFANNYKLFGFDEIVKKTLFPDFVVKRNDEEVGVELEQYSSEYKNHIPKETDYIICVIHNDREMEKYAKKVIEAPRVLDYYQVQYRIELIQILMFEEEIWKFIERYGASWLLWTKEKAFPLIKEVRCELIEEIKLPWEKQGKHRRKQ
jgi:hypothetical protein